MTADQIRSLQPAAAALLPGFRGCFKTHTTFGHGEKYLLGLMSGLKGKSIEPIALAAGGRFGPCRSFWPFPCGIMIGSIASCGRWWRTGGPGRKGVRACPMPADTQSRGTRRRGFSGSGVQGAGVFVKLGQTIAG